MRNDAQVLKDPQIFISKEARDVYDNLIKTYDEFKQIENKDFFMMALVFGYSKGRKKPLQNQDKTQSGFFRERNLSEGERAIFKAISIVEKGDISAITDIKYICSTVEEYANAGIADLKKFLFGNPTTFYRKYSSLLREILS